MKPNPDRMEVFTWEGELCARLSLFEDEEAFCTFFIEEELDEGRWTPIRIEHYASYDEAERRFDKRCDWYDSTGCFPVENPAFV